MKANLFLLIAVISLFSLSAFSQLKVSSTGKVGIGLDPDASYNLSTPTAIFKSGSTYSDLIIKLDPIAYGVFGMAMYPSINNYCKLGLSDKAFNAIWSYNITNLSDGRQKENIKDIIDPLGIILNLKGIKYDLKREYTYSVDVIKDEKSISKLEAQRKNKVGFIAQDVNTILPEVVRYDDSTDVYGVNYSEIVPVLVEAMKAQQAQIEALKSTVANCCANSLKSASIATGTTNNLAENVAELDQNIPNPFNNETRIGCFIPEGSGNSVLYIYNMNGTQLQQYNVTGKGKQSVTINGSSFEPGMYLYALVIDGKEVDTKRMILTK